MKSRGVGIDGNRRSSLGAKAFAPGEAQGRSFSSGIFRDEREWAIMIKIRRCSRKRHRERYGANARRLPTAPVALGISDPNRIASAQPAQWARYGRPWPWLSENRRQAWHCGGYPPVAKCEDKA